MGGKHQDPKVTSVVDVLHGVRTECNFLKLLHLASLRPYRIAMKEKLEFTNLVVRRLGLASAVRYFAVLLAKRLGMLPRQFMLTSRNAQYPLVCRRGTTDLSVFNQVFLDCEYDCVADARDVKLVIDCGANGGYSAAFFLSRFPNCTLVAVEPDEANFELLRENMRSYAERVQTIHAAVWSSSKRLELKRSPYRGGGEWAITVREAVFGVGEGVIGVDITELLSRLGNRRVDILKVDVEGAEVQMFAKGSYEKWLGEVDLIAIELHADSVLGDGELAFYSAMKSTPFAIATFGEITVAKRIVR